MKKRIVSLLLVLLMLLPGLALAATPAALNQPMATRSGPGTKYTEELGTFPVSTNITVVSQVDSNGTIWYQVEFKNNGKLYRAYTGKKRVNAYGSIPWENDLYTEDVTTAYVTPYYGPGDRYAKRRQSLDRGATVRVFQVEGEWALCDFREGSRWARGYINVSDLRNTVGVAITPTPVPTQAPTKEPRSYFNIIDPYNKICVDYYGNEYSYRGHDEEFAYMVGKLPVMSYFDGVPCIRSHTQVFSGPGDTYWCRWNSNGSGYAYTGKNDTNLRIYGKENGWIMIRYPSDANGGYRYGWVIPQAISVANQNKTEGVDFAYLPAVTTRFLSATDDPDSSLQRAGTNVEENVTVTALAFLNEDRDWVYCEYTLWQGGRSYLARGFIPASGLQLE